jgi:hypothetical protein
MNGRLGDFFCLGAQKGWNERKLVRGEKRLATAGQNKPARFNVE